MQRRKIATADERSEADGLTRRGQRKMTVMYNLAQAQAEFRISRAQHAKAAKEQKSKFPTLRSWRPLREQYPNPKRSG